MKSIAATVLMIPCFCGILLTFASCGGGGDAGTGTDAGSEVGTGARVPLANPFGVMMNLTSWPTVPAQLGVAYGRNVAAIIASTFTGACSSCSDIQGRRVLTVRPNGGGQVNPSTPVSNTGPITSAVTTAVANFAPFRIVYGNEVNSTTFYTGTAAEYRVELVAACNAAHAAGVLCANDGPTWEGVVAGAWADLIDSGQFTAACTLMQQTHSPSQAAQVCAMTAISQLSADKQNVISQIRALLPVYAQVPDEGNFHWYGSDPDALETVYRWFKSAIGGKVVIINEFGIREDNPAALRAIMKRMIALKVPVAIYYNVQAQPAFPLNDSGGNLTSLGTEYKAVIRENWP